MRRAASLAVLGMAGLAGAACGRRDHLPYRLYVWQDAHVPQEDLAAYEVLYVRAAEIRRGPDGVETELVRDTASVAPLPGQRLVPVVRVGHDVGREGVPWADLERELVAALDRLPAGEMHVDFDCPTGEIARYAALLSRLRVRGRKDVSTTALLDWFERGEGREIAEAASEVVLLAYGGRLPAAPEEVHDVDELDRLRALAPRLAVLPGLVVGLPAYGEAWVWNGDVRERYLTTFDLDALTEEPDAVLVSAPAASRGSIHRTATFLVQRPLALGDAVVLPGKRVQVVTPCAEALGSAAREVKELLGPALRAVAVHRLTRGEAGGLTLPELAFARGDACPPPVVDIERREASLDVRVEMAPCGRSAVGSGLMVELAWELPGAVLRRGSYDAVSGYGLVDGRRAASTARRATGATFQERFLAPGEIVDGGVVLATVPASDPVVDVELLLPDRVLRLRRTVPGGRHRVTLR